MWSLIVPAWNFWWETEQKTVTPQWLSREQAGRKHGFEFLLHPIWLSCPYISHRPTHSGSVERIVFLIGEGCLLCFFFYLFVKNTALFHAAREKGKQSSWNLERCQDIFSTQLLAINKTDILYLGHYSYVTAMLFCCCCCLFVLNKIEAMLAHTLY